MTYVPPKYPGEIPAENELFPWIDDEHYVSVEKFTAIVKELRAALIELGTDPAGAYDTVKAFLATLNTDKITGAQVPENETDPSVDDTLKGITLEQVRDHPAVFPAGIIAMWSGILANIPDGWALCDGGGGRPDLRSKFVKGAAASVNPGGGGGALTHSHTVNSHNHSIPSHVHGLYPSLNYQEGDRGAIQNTYDDPNTKAWGGTSGNKAPGTNSKNHEPPYYEIAYIIKT